MKDGEATDKKNTSSVIRPFRCRVGCIVALRQQHANTVTRVNADRTTQHTLLPSPELGESLLFVPPLPHRDSGLALIGKRIECRLPKDYEAACRSFRGTVISLPGYGEKKRKKVIKVHLLVDASLPSKVPGMQIVKAHDAAHGAAHPPSKKERKFRAMEEQIKGQNKVCVQVALQNFTDRKPGLAWEVATNVPPRLWGDATRQYGDRLLYMGDSNDTVEQQTTNYKWAVSRYRDMLHQAEQKRPTDPLSRDMLAEGFVGEVLHVQKHSNESPSLALVTLRRLLLPEDTAAGRENHHGVFDMYYDMSLKVSGQLGVATVSSKFLLQVPIEELVVIGRKSTKDADKDASQLTALTIDTGYSLEHDRYVEGLDSIEGSKRELDVGDAGSSCHRCLTLREGGKHRVCKNSACPLSEPFQRVAWCKKCRSDLRKEHSDNAESRLPCCRVSCDCRVCRTRGDNKADEQLMSRMKEHNSLQSDFFDEPLDVTAAAVESLGESAFRLKSGYLDVDALATPATTPILASKKINDTSIDKELIATIESVKSAPQEVHSDADDGAESAPKKRGRKRKRKVSNDDKREDYSTFKPTSARYLSLEEIRERKTASGMSVFPQNSSDRPRILRESRLETEKLQAKEEKVSSGRAARANQRRLMKGVVALGAGAAGLGLDTLASREPMLRFDRSSIHAWGVFADEGISAGTMIVEYRGELISRALADKREKEYEKANIPDYQFRIDNEVVCDATKQGNVARFINASCNPNCHTKIITTDGTKRIVIYAKRDIRIGEELCYDYKFPLEYDESKRIPCHCGSKDCRGFMNWDKRYVALPAVASASPIPSTPQNEETRTEATETSDMSTDMNGYDTAHRTKVAGSATKPCKEAGSKYESVVFDVEIP